MPTPRPGPIARALLPAALVAALFALATLFSPASSGRASGAGGITNVASFLDQCPASDPAYAQVRADFELRREGVPVGDVPCTEPVSAIPVAQYTDELIALQALRTVYQMDGGRSVAYPWTDGSLYDWMKSKIGGIDIRAGGSYCCERFGGEWFIVIGTQNQYDRDADRGWEGISDQLTLLAHETRHVDGFGHVGGCPLFPQSTFGCDQSYDEQSLAPYAVQWWLNEAWLTGAINVGFACPSPYVAANIAQWHIDRANNDFRLRFVENAPPAVTMPAQPGGPCPATGATTTPTASPQPTATPTPTAAPPLTATPTATASPTPAASQTPTASPSPPATPPSPSPTPSERPPAEQTTAATATTEPSPPLTSAPTPTPTRTPLPPPPAPTGTPAPTFAPADANCDGRTDAGDGLAVLRHLASLTSAASCTTGDANCNGATDVRDVLAVLRALAGLEAGASSCAPPS